MFEVTIKIESLGQAIIHLRRARRQHELARSKMKNCPSCRKQEKESIAEGVKFFDSLLIQLVEKIDVG